MLPKTPKCCDLLVKHLHSTTKWIASGTPRDLPNAWITEKPAIYPSTAFVIAFLLREHSPMSTTAIKIHLGLQVCDKADKGKVSHCWSLICRSTASSESHRDTARPVNPFQTTLFSHSILLLYNNTRTAARGWQEWQQDTEDASLDKLEKLFHHFSFHLEFLFSNAEKFPAVPVQGKVRKEMALKWNVPETFQIWSRKVSKYPDKKSWGICKCWLLLLLFIFFF